jgi:hypothetical protein
MAFSLRSKNNQSDIPLMTDIQVIFDKSSSMLSFGNSTRDQLYNLIQDQIKLAEENKQEINISIKGFNQQSITYVDNKSVLSLKSTTKNDFGRWVCPDGMTRFNDTVIECVLEQEKRVNEYMKNLPYVVRDLSPKINQLMYIITDGYNNVGDSSVEDVHTVITEARKRSVICILLAANRDATELANECGMDEKIAMSMGNDPRTTELAMGFTNTMIRGISSGSSRPNTLEFTELQRSSSQPADNYDLSTSLLQRAVNQITEDDEYDSDDDNTLPPPPFKMPQSLTRL